MEERAHSERKKGMPGMVQFSATNEDSISEGLACTRVSNSQVSGCGPPRYMSAGKTFLRQWGGRHWISCPALSNHKRPTLLFPRSSRCTQRYENSMAIVCLNLLQLQWCVVSLTLCGVGGPCAGNG